PDTNTPETRGRLAVLRAARRVDMIDHVGDWLLRARHQDLVLFRRFEGTDGVVDGDALAGIEAAVVTGVVPRQHLGIHRLGVKPLDDLHGFARLRRIDRHRLAVLRYVRPSVGP